VRLQIDAQDTSPSLRISCTDQRLTAHGGLIVWSQFLQPKKFRATLEQYLPHDPSSPNAYAPTDIARGYVGGILTGADKLSRVAWLQSDPAIAPKCSASKRSPVRPRSRASLAPSPRSPLRS